MINIIAAFLYKGKKLSVLKITFMLLCIVFTCACAELVKPNIKSDIKLYKEGEYSLDLNHASLLFKVNHMGFSDYVGRFNVFDASLSFDPANLDDASLSAVIDMKSIDLPDDSFENSLRGDKWFNVEVYPKALFRTTSVSYIDGNRMGFNGELTFLGKTNPITIDVVFNGGAFNFLTQKYTIGFSAKAEFLRSDYGLDRYVPTIGDKVAIEVNAEFQKD